MNGPRRKRTGYRPLKLWSTYKLYLRRRAAGYWTLDKSQIKFHYIWEVGTKKYSHQQSIFCKVSLIQRTFDSHGTALEDMGVDHCGLYILMSQQFLDGTDVVSVL